jgi:SpoVK/Ycf46/Vps4 family AAA+-type ATPase
MVLGLAIFTWDQKIGSVLQVKHPKSLDLSSELINKIYMTHAYSDEFENDELIQVNYKGKIILSYCDKTRVKDVGYEVLIVLLEEAGKVNIHQLKRDITQFGQNLFQLPKKEREDYFLKKVDDFYQETSAKKILILGRAGTGKTTIKKIVFEGRDPKDLLNTPLEPTRGISPSVHSWLDLELGLFDTSGQELQDLLGEQNLKEQSKAFENADVVLYLFDYQLWVNKREEIFKDIQKINSILQDSVEKAQLIFFFHKIDLIEQNNRKEVVNRVRERIEQKFGNKIYFTSIYPKLIYRLYNAFYEILSSFSKETSDIKEILDNSIKDSQRIMCFITNENNAIMIQTMSPDFNTLLINHTHKMIAQLTQSFENMAKTDDIEHIIISGSNSLNIIMNNLSLSKYKLNNLVIISERLSANKLIYLAGKIRGKLNSYLI